MLLDGEGVVAQAKKDASSPAETRKGEVVGKASIKVVPVSLNPAVTFIETNDFTLISPVAYKCRVVVVKVLSNFCFVQGK